MKNKKRGFTLIELLMTIIIISVVALIAVPILIVNINSARKQNKVTQDKVLIKAAGTHVSLNRLDNNGTIDYDTVCTDGSYVTLDCENGKIVTRCQILLNDMVKSGAIESFPSDVLDEKGNIAYNASSFVVIEFVDDLIIFDNSCVNCEREFACPPGVNTEPETPIEPDDSTTEPETPTEPDDSTTEPETPTESDDSTTVGPGNLVSLISGSCTPSLELQKYTKDYKTKYRIIMSPISSSCEDNLEGVTIQKITRLKTSDGSQTDLQFLYEKDNSYVIKSDGSRITADSIENYGTIAGDYGTYENSNGDTIRIVGYNNFYNFYVDENENKIYELDDSTASSLNSDALWSYNTNFYFEQMGFSTSKEAYATFIATRRYRHPFDNWICCDCPDDLEGVADNYCKVGIYSLSSITINEGNFSLSVNGTKQLTITYNPDTAMDKETTYKSSNINVATVDESGLVTAVGQGYAYITATANGKSQRIKVTVTDNGL